MSVYVLDLEYNPSAHAGREWEKMLPQPVQVAFDDFNRPTRLVERATRKPVRVVHQQRDVIVVHRSSIEENRYRIAAVVAIGIPVLIVSRELYRESVPGLEEKSGSCYYRRTGVLTMAEGVDVTFKEVFENFWQNYLDTGELNWANLEPEPCPKSLLDVYLVAKSAQVSPQMAREKILAAWNAQDKGHRSTIWQKAIEEYCRRGGSAEEWRAAGLPDLTREGHSLDLTPENIGGAVKAMEAVFPQ